jgi:hypothetical protein
MADLSTSKIFGDLSVTGDVNLSTDSKIQKNGTEEFLMTSAEKTKLEGIQSGAQVNSVTSVSGKTGVVTLAKTDVGLSSVDNVQQAPLTHVGATGGAHGVATTSVAGFMSNADKTKLDGIASGAQVNVATNLAQGTRTTTSVPITSSTGTSATLGVATTSLAGVMSSADKTKLDGIATGAQVNTVTSVAGKTGAVTLTNSDVGLGNVTNVAQAPASRNLTAGNGITGGGNLTADRTITLGTPSTLTTATTNSVTTDSHTHAVTFPVTSVAGKTGAVTLVKGDVGLGNVDNTSDANKPISTATQTALDGKVGKSGDTMTGALLLPASTTSSTSLRIPHGSSPTTLANGDVWTTTTSILARINGSTRTFIHNGIPTTLASDVSEAEARAGTSTTRRWFTAQRVKQAIESLTPQSADDQARLLQLILTNDKYKVTQFDTPSAGSITETIRLKEDDSAYATLVTVFDSPTTGDITTTLQCTDLGIHNRVIVEFDTPSAGEIKETSEVVS